MTKTELKHYQRFVVHRLQELTPFLQQYAMGDFTQTLPVPEKEDEFTELLVGLNLMVDDFREMITERMAVEADLKQRYDVIQLTYKISGDFHNLPNDQIDAGINTVLEALATFVGANRSSLFLVSQDLSTITNTHEWCESPDDSQIDLLQGIPFDTFGAHAVSLKRHKSISISTIDDYPEDAIGEREWVEQNGFRSLLFVPLLWQGKLFGTLGIYGEIGKEIDWSEIFIRLLNLVGDILVSTLNRRAAELDNSRLGRILENSLNEIYMFDVETLKFSHVNRGAQENIGYSMNELSELTPLDLKTDFTDEHFAELLQPLRDGSKEIITFETVHQRKDGTKYNVEVSLQLDQSTEQPSFVAIIMDITARKKAEDAIRREKDFTDAALDNQVDTFFLLEPETGKGIRWNKTFRDITGYSDEDIATLPAPRTYYEDDDLKRVKAFIPKVLESGRGSITLDLISKDGRKIPMEYQVSAMSDDQGESRYLISVGRDISKRKKSERRLVGLNNLKENLIGPGSLYEKMEHVTNGVVEIFDADFARIWIVNQGDLCEFGCMHADVNDGPHVCRDRDRCLRLVASSGRYTHIDGTVHRRVPFGSYKIGRVAAAEEAGFITNDVVNDERVHNPEWARELGLKSFAGFQLQSQLGNTIGVLAVFSQHPFSKNDETMLQTIARTASEAIQVGKTMEALAESEERLRLAISAGSLGLYDLDVQTGDAKVNEEYARMLGYDLATFVESHAAWLERLHPDDLERVSRIFDDYINGKIPEFRVEFRQRTCHGEWKWILSQGELVERNAEGKPVRMLGTHLDIDGRKKNEQILEDHTRKLELSNKQLETFNRMAIGREQRMVELKREINQLSEQLGLEDPYDVSFADA